ncbi:CYFA0S25e01574g1_1 [Cyberlindnera fabianii]|uniref:CYFA0S25e01574g1_1 n=1 Tax=Cyberlindnera fabianii TaxID=36022 RepID=A0A061B9X5_CYBFA|nr:CYFA0S25e01574g1_1 [Cyberlindnera fabianii]
MSLKLENGLNVPQISRNTALDRIFAELEQFLSIDDTSCTPDALSQLYLKTQSPRSDASLITKIDALTSRCFNYVHTIQELSLAQAQQQLREKDQQKANLITISLHDMKFFNELINVIIVQCIYPCLPLGVGIPIDQRRLKTYGKRLKVYRFQRVPKDEWSRAQPVLESIVEQFDIVFNQGGDIADLLKKGSGFTDVLTALMTLYLETGEQKYLNKFIHFENKSESYNLFGTYTAMIQGCKVGKYQQFLSKRLNNTMMNRSNGVSSLMDFIVGVREDEEINIEKFANVNRILLSKPQDITSVEYFTKIFDQIYDILVMINRPVLVSVSVNFIRVVYDKNKKIIQDFLFKKIWASLDPNLKGDEQPGDTIVSEKQLNDAINVVISLSKETSAEFLNDLFSRIILNLWCYYFYLKKRKLEYSAILSNIMVTLFTVTSNKIFLENIVLNLINTQGDGWKFQTTLENNLTSIVKTGPLDAEITSSELLNDIDLGLEIFVELLKNLTNDVIREQFIIVLNRWILKQDNHHQNEDTLDETNPFIMLIDLKFLEKMNESFKDALMDKPASVLQVILNLLKVKFEVPTIEDEQEREPDSDDEEEDLPATPQNNMTILLELLSAILTETPHSELSKHKTTLESIANCLSTFPNNIHCTTLYKRITDFLSDSPMTSGVEDERTLDKELFEQAITSLNDPLIPIRAHGLYLLRQLIMKKSDVLALDFVLELHIVQLRDQEPFIYLSVIKSLNELIEFDKEGTLKFLLEFYSNKKEKLDERLKIGEVVLQFIDHAGELLTGELVDEVLARTLTIVRDFEEDDRIRMSAMSLIGEALRVNARGVDKFIKDSLDCSIGVLQMEKQDIMKRAAVVLIADLIAFGGLEIVPRGYGSKIKSVLEYTRNSANDYLLVEQIEKVLGVIDELFKEKFNPTEIPSQFGSLKISK